MRYNQFCYYGVISIHKIHKSQYRANLTRLCRNAKKQSKVQSKKEKKEEKNQKKNLHGLVLFSGKKKSRTILNSNKRKKKNRTKHRTSPTKVSRMARDSQEKNRKRTSLDQSKK